MFHNILLIGRELLCSTVRNHWNYLSKSETPDTIELKISQIFETKSPNFNYISQSKAITQECPRKSD